MEWFVSLAPVPDGAVEFSVGSGAIALAAALVALTPLWLVLRRALGWNPVEHAAPQLRVIEGGKELKRRAA
jgi:hypothetical protein